MREIDRSNIDALYWAEKFVQHKEAKQWQFSDIDVDLMWGWFADCLFAVSYPMEGTIAQQAERIKELDGYNLDYAVHEQKLEERIEMLNKIVGELLNDPEASGISDAMRDKLYMALLPPIPQEGE